MSTVKGLVFLKLKHLLGLDNLALFCFVLFHKSKYKYRDTRIFCTLRWYGLIWLYHIQKYVRLVVSILSRRFFSFFYFSFKIYCLLLFLLSPGNFRFQKENWNMLVCFRRKDVNIARSEVVSSIYIYFHFSFTGKNYIIKQYKISKWFLSRETVLFWLFLTSLFFCT